MRKGKRGGKGEEGKRKRVRKRGKKREKKHTIINRPNPLLYIMIFIVMLFTQQTTLKKHKNRM